MRILILEDDPFREQEFRRLLKTEGLDFSLCSDPLDFLRELAFSSADVKLLSLDHDLSHVERSCGVMSLDCGCAVVEFMKGMKPFCPVIVHSQNEIAAAKMSQALKEAGWKVEVVSDPPEAEGSWIELSWIELIRRGWGSR